jgi:uncharacterized membrane protein
MALNTDPISIHQNSVTMKTAKSKTQEEAPDVSTIPPATGSSMINVGLPERLISIAGGAALSVAGIRNIKGRNGIALLLGGGYLLARGISGYCFVNSLIHRNSAQKKASAIEVTSTYTINKKREEVYAFWRKLENLPRFMKHLEEVKETDDTKSTWKARIPGGLGTLSWEAEIVEDQPNTFISWCSLPGASIDNAGEVTFRDAALGQRTEIQARISYRLPAGDIGSLAGKLFNPVVKRLIQEDLQRFKEVMETGQVAVPEG